MCNWEYIIFVWICCLWVFWYMRIDISSLFYFFFCRVDFSLRLIWVVKFWKISLCFSSCSYHWIKRKGKPARRELAPIVVSNHLSFIEPIFYFYELFPTIVASESHDSLPFVGTIIRAMQVISVLCTSILKFSCMLVFMWLLI